MRLAASTVVLVLIAAPGWAQSLPDTTGESKLANAAPATAEFVTRAMQTDMFERQSGQLAEKQGTPAVKPFATQMITDHKASMAKLKSVVDSHNIKVSLPPRMSDTQTSMLNKLATLHGTDFDKIYADDQFDVHNTAVNLFQRYASQGGDQNLKEFASQTLPTLRHHLQMAKALMNSVKGGDAQAK